MFFCYSVTQKFAVGYTSTTTKSITEVCLGVYVQFLIANENELLQHLLSTPIGNPKKTSKLEGYNENVLRINFGKYSFKSFMNQALSTEMSLQLNPRYV